MQEKLKLEVGKSYRTRGGLKATVTGYEPTRGRYPFIGRVDDEAFSWTNDGRFIFSSKPDSFDLIAPWEEQPEPESHHFDESPPLTHSLADAPDFRSELCALINKHSMESGSNTPDFILGQFFTDVFMCFNKALRRRDEWYIGPVTQSVTGSNTAQQEDTSPVTTNAFKDALRSQVGGSHYKDMAIQPVEFCQKNGLNYCESNVVKYVCRHRSKNGRQDIEKAIHYLQLLLEMEYQEKTERVSL